MARDPRGVSRQHRDAEGFVLISDALRLWNTVRWLRPGQITGRIRRRFVSPAPARSVNVDIRTGRGNWTAPARREASFELDGTATFLNQSGVLATARDWDRPEVPRLWRYNLHYFDDLNAEGAEARKVLHSKLMERWIDENPPTGGTGWEPYPCSLRIVNWIKWALAGNDLRADWQRSLALQTDWLSKNLEWHLLGNHLFANAKAMVYSGSYFDGPAAKKWLDLGLEILERELPEQVLADGGQFERSPMYHALALEDVLDLINVAACHPDLIADRVVSGWRHTAGRMLTWEKAMKHPDDEIALFNDSAMRIAPAPVQLEEYGHRLGISGESIPFGVTHLSDSGYVRAENESAVTIVDVGDIGPDYLPAHAHADTLSFELSLFGDRWIVDPGCSTYENSSERLRQRGTAAHNTVTVDGQDSSEVWSSFRVARRARPLEVSTMNDASSLSIAAAHDGYRRLKGRVIHHRSVELLPSSLLIRDSLEGSFKRAESNFLLHPEVDVARSDGQLELTRDRRSIRFAVSGGQADVRKATWHPEFGTSIATKRIRVRFLGQTLATTLTWVSDLA